ncbi:MAG: hypothetical protein H5T64_09450 [Chloroflexi bacterium]|nr:hypothetical protein [Chloroflexota bacterium]
MAKRTLNGKCAICGAERATRFIHPSLRDRIFSRLGHWEYPDVPVCTSCERGYKTQRARQLHTWLFFLVAWSLFLGYVFWQSELPFLIYGRQVVEILPRLLVHGSIILLIALVCATWVWYVAYALYFRPVEREYQTRILDWIARQKTEEET